MNGNNNQNAVITVYQRYKVVIGLISFSLLFIKLLFFQNVWWMIDFNETKSFRALCWFNICVIILSVPQNIALRVFGHRYLSALGKYTFCWYISHIPIYRVIGTNVIAKYKLLEIYKGPYEVVVYVLAIGITMLLGVAFYEIVDKRMRKHIVQPAMGWFRRHSQSKTVKYAPTAHQILRSRDLLSV